MLSHGRNPLKLNSQRQMSPSWTGPEFAASSNKNCHLSGRFGSNGHLFAKLNGNARRAQGTGPASAEMTAFDRSLRIQKHHCQHCSAALESAPFTSSPRVDFSMAFETEDLRNRPSEPSPESRLDSWKEIAAYLKCSERTVRRWEQEGLPVHRHAHKKRAGVYAYKPELEAWWNDGHARLEELERAQAPQNHNLSLWLTTAGLAIVVSISGLYLARARIWHRASPPAGKIMLAILPFENLSDDPEQEYFSEGLTEEMISRLGQMEPQRLGVIARTSA